MTHVNSKIMFILRAGIICDYGAILVQCGPSSNPTSHMWVIQFSHFLTKQTDKQTNTCKH